MSDEKRLQPQLSAQELEQSLLPRYAVIINGETLEKDKTKKIISDHAMQIAEDKELDMALGTFNTALGALITANGQDVPSASQDLERVDRSVAFLKSAKKKNPKLAIIALQESISPALPLDSKETSEAAIQRLAKEAVALAETDPVRTEKLIQLYKLKYVNPVWERANLKANLPSWHAVTDTGPHDIIYNFCNHLYKTILYDTDILEEVEDAKFNFDTLDSDITRRVQAIQLRKKSADGEPFIVYNIHLPHQNDPILSKRYIDSILNLPHNQGKTVYIMGDFNARFPSTTPKLVNNGTSLVPTPFAAGGARPTDCTDAIFKKTPTDEKPKRLDTQIVHPLTSEAMPLPEVSAETATGNSKQANYWFPVVDYADHQIVCADGKIRTDRELISNVKAGLGKNDQKEEISDLKNTPVFLEKNIYNNARITINASLLNSAQIAALKALGLFHNEIEPYGWWGPASPLVARFSLYPRLGWQYKILQDMSFLKSPQLVLDRHRSSLNLQRAAKFIGVIAAIAAAISIAFFAASTLFVPAVFLAAGAGLLAVAAAAMRAVGKYRENYPLFDQKPLAYAFAAAGTAVAVGAGFVWGFAPAVAFAGIPLAPVVLIFTVAAIFLAAAAFAASRSKLVVPDVGGGATPAEVGRGRSSSELQHAPDSKHNPLTQSLLSKSQKNYSSTEDAQETEGSAAPHSKKDGEKSSLVKSMSSLFKQVGAGTEQGKETPKADIDLGAGSGNKGPSASNSGDKSE